MPSLLLVPHWPPAFVILRAKILLAFQGVGAVICWITTATFSGLTLIFRRFFGFGPFFYHSGLGHFNELRHGLLPILVAARTPRVRSFDPHIDALAPFFSRLLCLSIINIALRVFMGLVFL